MANSTSAPETTTTAPPDSRLVADRLDFWARQVVGEVTTCGYFNGNPASPLTCASESSCLSDTSANVHMCGRVGFAFPPTACLDSTAYVTACDAVCRGGLSTKACTSGINTFCATIYWNSPFGTNPPMSEFNCTTAPMTLTVTSAADVSVAPSSTTTTKGASLIAPSTNSNGASITSTSSGSGSPTGSTGSSSSGGSSGLSHNDIIYIVVGIVGFFIVAGLAFEAIRRWRRWRRPVYGFNSNEAYSANGGYNANNYYSTNDGYNGSDGYRYPLDTRTHVSESTWPTSYTPTTLSGLPGSRSEVLPEDSVSQVHVPVPRPARQTDLYSHAPTGSVGL